MAGGCSIATVCASCHLLCSEGWGWWRQAKLEDAVLRDHLREQQQQAQPRTAVGTCRICGKRLKSETATVHAACKKKEEETARGAKDICTLPLAATAIVALVAASEGLRGVVLLPLCWRR